MSLSLHLKKYTIRGFLAIVPISISIFAIRFLYIFIDQRMMNLMERVIGFSFPGLGFILILITLYFVGLAASNLVGKQFFKTIDRIADRIPLISTTQKIGKQLVETLSLPEKQAFKRAVLVPFLKPGIWAIGFVTGEVFDEKSSCKKLLKVFVPTPPNPLTGTVVLISESEVKELGWTIEEAVKTIITVGIIGPPQIGVSAAGTEGITADSGSSAPDPAVEHH